MCSLSIHALRLLQSPSTALKTVWSADLMCIVSSLAGEVIWEDTNTVSFKASKIEVKDRGGRSSWGDYTTLVLLSACVHRTTHSVDTGLSFAWIPAWRGSKVSAGWLNFCSWQNQACICSCCIIFIWCCTLDLGDTCWAIVLFLPLNPIQHSLF